MEGDYHCTPAEIKSVLREKPGGTISIQKWV